MAFREVSVVQVKEALRRWLKGEGERPIARSVGVDRKTARRYITAAIELGIDRSGGEEQLTDELIGQVLERVRPHRIDGHGEAWRALFGEEKQITAWVKEGLTVTKIGILLERKGVVVPPRTLARFAVERCGAGRRTVTVRVDDPPPGIELQVDFGRLGLVRDGEKRRVCQGLIFTACFSRHQFVWPTFSQTTEEVVRGFEAAWGYFGGYVGNRCQDASSSIRSSNPSKILCLPIWPFFKASSRWRSSVGLNSMVVTKNEQDSQIDSKWQSISTGRAQYPLPWTKMRQAYRLLGLVKKWGAGRVEEACQRALDAEAIDVNLVSRMIERARESTEPETRPDPVVIQGRFARDPSEFSSAKEDRG